jgi:hypothetical protein
VALARRADQRAGDDLAGEDRARVALDRISRRAKYFAVFLGLVRLPWSSSLVASPRATMYCLSCFDSVAVIDFPAGIFASSIAAISKVKRFCFTWSDASVSRPGPSTRPSAAS